MDAAFGLCCAVLPYGTILWVCAVFTRVEGEREGFATVTALHCISGV